MQTSFQTWKHGHGIDLLRVSIGYANVSEHMDVRDRPSKDELFECFREDKQKSLN